MSWLAEQITAWKRAYSKKRLQDECYAYLFDEPVAGSYVCFDCETTGLDPKKDSIITLSAIKIQENQVLTSQALNLTIKQDKVISAESIRVHRIRNVDVEQTNAIYADEREAMEAFLQFIHQSTLVGYYLEFDVAMVNSVIKPWLGVGLPNPKIEVSELYYQRELNRQKHGYKQVDIDLKFTTILKKLELPNLGQHDAFSDALMTALIFIKLQRLQQG